MLKVIIINCIYLLLLVTSFASHGLNSDSLLHPHQNQFHHTNKKYLKIGRIIVIGNKVTKTRIILRELDIEVGDFVYDQDLEQVLEIDRNKIYNLRLFNTVLIRPIEVEPGVIDILIEVSERWFFFPVPLFDLADRNFNDWWQNQGHDLSRVNYGVKLYYNNVRGRNESLRLTLQGGFTRNVEILYRIPYLDRSQRHGISFGYGYSETANLPYTTINHKQLFLREDEMIRKSRGGLLGYTYRKNFYEFHSFQLDFRSIQVADTIPFLNAEYFVNNSLTQNLPSITYQYNRDKRDIGAYPLNGYQFIGFIRKFGIGMKNEINRFDFNVSYAKYTDLNNGNYFSNFTYFYASLPSDQPYALYNALGFKQLVVRGYELYLVEGPQIFLNKTTLKKRIFAYNLHIDAMPIEQFKHFPIAIYLKGYFDFGVVSAYPNYEQEYFLNNKLLTGAGFGLDIVTSYDSVLRLEYSFTNMRERGFFLHLKREF